MNLQNHLGQEFFTQPGLKLKFPHLASLMFVNDLAKKYTEELGLKIIAGKAGLSRLIPMAEIEKPGLCLTGYLKGFIKKRILIFGRLEIGFLKTQPAQKRSHNLKNILTRETPLMIVAERLLPTEEMLVQCEKNKIPLFRSHLPSMPLMNRLFNILIDEQAISSSCHGSFVEIFGIGVLIQGEAGIGKSEAALGLIKRGHRLISDDLVKIKKKDEMSLEGCGFDTSRHHLELKGVGIVNIARLYGTVAVREKKSLDIVVKLEVCDDSHFYDHDGFKEKTITLLGVKIPFHTLYVKAGRDIVSFLETIALNHRLKHLSAIEKKG